MRKQRQRRRYRLDANPVLQAVRDGKPLSGPDLQALRILELMSLDALARGQATPQDLGVLRRLVVLAAALAEAGIGPEVLRLVEIVRRRRLTEPMMADVLHELVALHDQQRVAVSRGVYEAEVARYLAG